MFLKGHSVYCLCICSNCLLSMRSWIVVLEHRKFRSVVIQFCGIILYLINYPFTCLLFRNLYCNVCSKNIVTRPNQIFCQLFMISVESKPYWSDEHAGSVRCTGCWNYSCITGVGCRVHVEKKTPKGKQQRWIWKGCEQFLVLILSFCRWSLSPGKQPKVGIFLIMFMIHNKDLYW